MLSLHCSIIKLLTLPLNGKFERLTASLLLCQPDHADALKEIIDIKAQVQRRIAQPVPQRAPTAEPEGQHV